jgi:hypothetical protein
MAFTYQYNTVELFQCCLTFILLYLHLPYLRLGSAPDRLETVSQGSTVYCHCLFIGQFGRAIETGFAPICFRIVNLHLSGAIPKKTNWFYHLHTNPAHLSWLAPSKGSG